MKMRSLFAGTLAVAALVSFTARAADLPVKYYARSGSKMRIDGTANMIHTTWRVQGDIIQGHLYVGPGFPTEAGQTASAGPMPAEVEVAIPANSLKSIEPDGSHYSDAMDNIMYEKLKAADFKKIIFTLKELTLKEPAKGKDSPYVFDAKGDLALVGVTNAISMTVNVLPLADKKLKITGSVPVKMTDFKMKPPTALAGALITGDKVDLSWEWIVAPRTTPTAAAAK